MMELNEEQLERLISRKLDGELSESETLEFDRELLRNPQARAMYDRYAQLDALAGDVLRECVTPKPRLTVPETAASAAARVGAPRRNRLNDWMLLASALAACMAIIVFVRTPAAHENVISPASTAPIVASNVPNHAPTNPQMVSHPRNLPTVGMPAGEGGVWQVGHQASPRVDRRTDRNVILLTDDKGNLYWVNVDHIREIERPNDEVPAYWASKPI